MNNQRRKRLDNIILKISEICSEIEVIGEEEQESFDNLNESLQYGEKGIKMEEAISEMQNAVSMLEEAQMFLETAKL